MTFLSLPFSPREIVTLLFYSLLQSWKFSAQLTLT